MHTIRGHFAAVMFAALSSFGFDELPKRPKDRTASRKDARAEPEQIRGNKMAKRLKAGKKLFRV